MVRRKVSRRSPFIETQESLKTLWDGPARVFLWTDQDDPNELAGLQHFLLARRGGKAIFTNRAP